MSELNISYGAAAMGALRAGVLPSRSSPSI